MRRSLRAVVSHSAVPYLVAIVMFLLTWGSAAGIWGVAAHVGTPLVLVVATLSGAAAGLARRRPWPLFVMAAVGWAWLAMWPLPLLASYHAGTLARSRGRCIGYIAGAVVVMGVGVLVAVDVGGPRAVTTATPGNVVTMALLLIVLPFVAGLWLDARQVAVEAVRDRAERRRREQEARVEQIRAQERTRIAREMHDVVAHKISLLVLHAGAMEVSATDSGTVESAALLRSIGREALVDLRQTLGVLRSAHHAADAALAPQPALEDLDRLLGQSRSAGLSVTRHDVGDVRRLPSTVERAAYRVVQEALTNVHKHAGRVPAHVTLRFTPDQLDVTVVNSAPGSRAEPMPGSGSGLVGLRERVELLGGTLQAHRRANGEFEVHARIPVELPA